MAALHLAPKTGAVTVARERRAVMEALAALAPEKWRAERPEFGRIPSFVRLDRNMVVRLRIFLAVWDSVGQPVSDRANFIKDYSGRDNAALAKFLAEKTRFLCIPQKRAGDCEDRSGFYRGTPRVSCQARLSQSPQTRVG